MLRFRDPCEYSTYWHLLYTYPNCFLSFERIGVCYEERNAAKIPQDGLGRRQDIIV